MDASLNPFEPSAGRQPPELAGREQVLEAAKVACTRLLAGRSANPMVLWGLRGTGKTVLLNAIKKNAEAIGLIVSKVEAPEGEKLAKLLFPEMRKVLLSLSITENAKNLAKKGLSALRNFGAMFKIKYQESVEIELTPSPGLADSGDIEYDLPELFSLIGKAAAAENKGWVLLIDELQYLTAKELSALIVALHTVSQEGIPVLIFGAGLPQILALAGEAKSYAERLFDFYHVESLSEDAVRVAVRKPLEKAHVTIAEDALERIVEGTHGYPFFVQLWAYNTWNTAKSQTISLEDVQAAYTGTISQLDEGFFKVRMDRLTNKESQFVKVMSELGDGPYSISDIAKGMGSRVNAIGPHRAKLISKGMIYSSGHGRLEFSVPLFAEYLMRQQQKVL